MHDTTLFRRADIAFLPGSPVGQCIRAAGIPPELDPYLHIRLNGMTLLSPDEAITRDGDMIEVFVTPAGGGGEGKNGTLAAVAMIAIAVAAPYAAVGLLGATAGTVGALTAAGHAASAAITLAGAMAVNALVPPPSVAGFGSGLAGASRTSPTQESRTYQIGGVSNAAALYSRVPRLYGRNLYTPPLAATPRVTNIGKTSKVAALYDFGIGDVQVQGIRVGGASIDVLEPEMRIHRDTADPPLELLSGKLAYDQRSHELEKDVPLILRTAPDSSGLTLDLTFPGGLVRFNSSGERFAHSAGFVVRYRKAGDPSWQTAPASAWSGASVNEQNLVYTAQYDVPVPTQDGSFPTGWRVSPYSVKTGARGALTVRLGGRTLYSALYKGNSAGDADRKQSITVGGVQYRRGAQRASGTGSGNRQYVFFEVLAGAPAPGEAVILSESTAQPFVASLDLNLPERATWELEITRVTDVTPQEESNSLRDAASVTLLKSASSGDILSLRKPHTMLEVEYTATDKVSGVVDNLSADCETLLREFDSTGFTGGTSVTSNPARIVVDLLTGVQNRRPADVSRLDWPAFDRLQKKCDTPVTTVVNGVSYAEVFAEFNGVIDTEMSVRDACAAVLAPARSVLTIGPDGLYTVLTDEEQAAPRQLITPANSWNFSGSRSFTDLPDALRVAFLDEEREFAQSICLVFRDGMDASTAEVYEDLQTFGITSYAQAWRYGRYMMGQGILRSETFSLEMDIENLVVRRGDMVTVQHDVPATGGASMRVTGVAGSIITTDRDVALGGSGVYTARKLDGTIRQGTLQQTGPGRFRVDLPGHFEEDALVSIGSGAVATRDCIVMGIVPGADLTATLTLSAYDPALYRTDGGLLPEWNPGFGDDLVSTSGLAIQWESQPEQEWEFPGRVPQAVLRLRWEVLARQAAGQAAYRDATYRDAIVEARAGNGAWELVAQSALGDRHADMRIPASDRRWFLDSFRVRVTPRNSLGVEGAPITAVVTLRPYQAKPEPPRNAFLDVRSEEVTLFWDASKSEDVDSYVIRYSPRLGGAATWASSQHAGRTSWNQTEFSTGARTGTYMIRARNTSGTLSDVVKLRTTIEALPNLNVIETLQDDPAWPGTLSGFTRGRTAAWSYADVTLLDGTAVQVTVPPGWNNSVTTQGGGSVAVITDVDVGADTLVSAAAWDGSTGLSRSTYTFSRMVDLNTVQECRVQNLLEAYARDTGANAALVTTFAGVLTATPEAGEQDADWNAWLEYRAIEDIDVMANWPNLSGLATLSQGSGVFSEWRKLNVGSVTGRIFQFRIVAEAYRRGVLVMITRGKVEVDMPDRVWRSQNIAVPASGVTVNFDPAFAVPPVIAVTVEGAGSAIRYKATALTRGSVNIVLEDGAGAAVAGRIDIAALGYGKERVQVI